MSDIITNQLSKFKTKNWDEKNDDGHEMYNTNSQIKLRTTVIKSNLCNYSDAYIFMKGNITVVEQRADTVDISADRKDKELIFEHCAA